MIINFSGKTSKFKREHILCAAEFFAETLLGKRMAKNITLDLEVKKNYEFKGECCNEDRTRRSRYFTIILRECVVEEMIKTLAHEMVHLKQHVRNELGEKRIVFKKDEILVMTQWKGELWSPRADEDEHYDSPWEIEAYGRELGLAHRYVNYVKTHNQGTCV